MIVRCKEVSCLALTVAGPIALDSQVSSIKALLCHVYLARQFILLVTLFLFELATDILVPDDCFDVVDYGLVARLKPSPVR